MSKIIKGLWRRIRIAHETFVSLYYFELRSIGFYLNPKPHIQVMTVKRTFFANWNYFRWLRKNRPKDFSRLRFTRARAPFSKKMKQAEALFNWIATPKQIRSSKTKECLLKAEAEFKQANLKIINPIKAIENTLKATALDLIASTGILTGKTILCNENNSFTELEMTLGSPFLIRSNSRHSAPIHLIQNQGDLDKIEWHKITDPAASSYIDTQDKDGYYRKYRYVMFGNNGINRHLVLSDHWWQHGADRLSSDQQKNEELAYYNTAPAFHEELNRARIAIGLDYLAFDYSITADGQLVIWEPNALPILWNKKLNYTGPMEYSLQQNEKVFTFISQHLFNNF